MKWTIEKNVILEALNNVTKALSQRTTIPVLNGIVFDVSEGGIELLASDSELTIKVIIPSTDIKYLEGSGKIIIQSKYFVDMIRKMPSDLIDFEVEDNLKIKISTPNNQYRLNCYNPNDYPNIMIDKGSDVINVNSQNLRELINQTSYALSTQEVRPLLTGINLKINGDILECICTDSYRLSKKNIKLATPVNKQVNIVIPGRSITELEKIIADDDNIIREGLKMIISSQLDFEIVSVACNGAEAVELCRKYKTDIALLDIRMPVMDGIEAARILLEENLCKPLLLTTFDEQELIQRALKVGVSGYILKNTQTDGIFSALRTVYNGGTVFQQDILSYIRDAAVKCYGKSAVFDLLTERELDIVKLIAEGCSNAEIAEKLFLSNGTVRNYISVILEKTGLEHRTQIAVRYLKGDE